MPAIEVVEHSEEERCAKLGMYFYHFLHGWLTTVRAGVRWSPGVADELTMALLAFATATAISNSASTQSPHRMAEQSERLARELFDRIKREVTS